jgi:hypothetical protein
VVGLGVATLNTQDWPQPTEICSTLNNTLATSTHSQVHISTAKWNACGNLVITVGHNTSVNQLRASLPFISAALRQHFSAIFKKITNTPPIRANVKWSHILLNKVPMGTTLTHKAYILDECHRALTSENPLYALLTITQCPSWV